MIIFLPPVPPVPPNSLYFTIARDDTCSYVHSFTIHVTVQNTAVSLYSTTMPLFYDGTATTDDTVATDDTVVFLYTVQYTVQQ